jgi:hypothetical protein
MRKQQDCWHECLFHSGTWMHRVNQDSDMDAGYFMFCPSCAQIRALQIHQGTYRDKSRSWTQRWNANLEAAQSDNAEDLCERWPTFGAAPSTIEKEAWTRICVSHSSQEERQIFE